ncbi:DNA polymerase III subunit gamma/tau [bacterium]|nr:DNA polymerase III subunit gamma/tau [bacterium]
MSYIPLYRKYRPQQLEEVVGQEHVKRALTNAIETNKISHAYLFTGPRGTGKTSTARIFAKSLNCEKGPTINPCGKCPNCIDITNSTPMDVIEIDAASNRSVEDAEKIIERVMYAPVNSRYKIYIIDEVHMLSTTAFNALLKTLEEPPQNVIFILATTEVHKVLDTIKSRCQRYDFKRITTDDITKQLKMIAQKEGINITDDALITIAKTSAGGMRDSISLLEQLSVLGGEITTKDIDNLLGRLSFDILSEFSDKIVNSKPNEAIEILDKVYNSGNEPALIMTNLLDYFRNLLIVKTCEKDKAIELSQLNDEQLKVLSNQAKNLETHQILSLINKCSDYVKEIKSTTNPKLWLEVGIIDLANLTENTTLAKLQERITALENGSPQSVSAQPVKITAPAPKPSAKPVINEKPVEKTEEKPSEAKAPVSEPPKEDIPVMPTVPQSDSTNDISNLWARLLSVTKAPTNALLKQWANPVEITEEKIVIGIKNQVFLPQFESGSKRDALLNGIKELYGKEVPLTVRLSKPEDKAVSPRQSVEKTKTQKTVSAPKPENEHPKEDISLDEVMEISDEVTPEENMQNAEYAGQSDLVKMTLQVFNGKIIE